MPFDVGRLLNSNFWALSEGDEFKAAFSLWMRSWLQVPAASLPADDRILAVLSGAHEDWAERKQRALHGWLKCSDGRLYHPMIAELALAAHAERLNQRERSSVEHQRVQRHRAERAVMRDALRAAGQKVSSDIPMKELRQAYQKLTGDRASNAPAT
ncbi:DUF1376 domain-containing protein [Muricoccus radiodurans]|uniref:DUF1376 domain-containing protein n=1 Tax=Muricoccus radiodurans TaxID=2231721 RepID=UPI003CF287C4